MPEQSLFDENGEMVVAGDKFYTPFDELIAYDPTLKRWIKMFSAKEVAEARRAAELDVLEPVDDDWLPYNFPMPT